MTLKNDFCCTFIGLGLIGGSIAKAMRKNYPNCKLYAYNRHPENIKAALDDKTLDGISEEITTYIPQSDIIFLCAPVITNIKNLEVIKPFLSENTLITDVGSVKGNIHDAVASMGLESMFIGGHPMCGSEKTGYKNAREDLLENAYYILTPGKGVSQSLVDDYTELVNSMHAIPLISEPNKHDFSTAAISHVPHIIAGELVRLIMDNDSEDEFMKTIAAGGFKDITRIASSSPDMWQNICESNSTNITDLIDKYIERLSSINQKMKMNNFDCVGDLFREAGPYRESMNDLKGTTTQKIYQLYLNLPDKTGAIAKVASILANHSISIRNIGITHNREHRDGVLYIVFYNSESLEQAVPLLTGEGYQIV